MTQSPSSTSSSPHERLDVSDVTHLLRLMGELASLRNDPRTWRLALLSAMNQLLPATVSAAFILKNLSMDAPPVIVSLFDAGFKNDNHRQAFLREFNTVPFRDPLSRRAITRFLEAHAKSLTFLRSDLVDDDTWHNSLHIQEFRVPSHTDDALFSIHRAADRGHAFVLCAYRALGDAAPFRPRARALVDTLHNGLDWLYKGEEASHRINRASALAPRLRQTLDYLLAGDTERQVALKMSLSVHTVHDYVKALYLHFGVSSRGELISRWMQTAGQLSPPQPPASAPAATPASPAAPPSSQPRNPPT